MLAKTKNRPGLQPGRKLNRKGLTVRCGKLLPAVLTVLVWSLPAGTVVADSGTGRALESETSWTVRSETTLRTTLEAWSLREGWDLVWDAKNDYRLRASADLGPDFLIAIRALADAVNMSSPDLTVTLYFGNRVIHVRDSLQPNN